MSDEIGRLQAALDREPRSHRFARLADLYRKSGELRRGLDVVDAGLLHHPHYLNACLVRARILEDLGERQAAREAFERVLEIDDENQLARSAVTRLSEEEPTPTPARGWAERASGTADWLANLEAAWRDEPGPPPAGPAPDTVPKEREAPATPQARPAARGSEVVARDTGERPRATRVGSASMETGTMAALYLEQGLYDEAIAMYERLLARDPYNVSLAAGLDRARQRGAGVPAASPAAAPAPAPAGAVRRSPPAGDRDRLTARHYLMALLDGDAPDLPVDVPPAVERLRRTLADGYARSD